MKRHDIETEDKNSKSDKMIESISILKKQDKIYKE